MNLRRFALLVLILALANVALCGEPVVRALRAPNGGIQPQSVVGADGSIHLIYFGGDPKAGDIFYVTQGTGHANFSKPLRVNSEPGSAIAMGTIRGAHIALGKGNRVHVAWNGSHEAKNHPGAPMLYTRMNDAGTAFEPQRDVINFTGALDGGGSLAADRAGNVFVVWHGSPPGNTENEAGRAVFIARSTDEGKTFGREKRANAVPTGACGCCGLRAFADSRGNLFTLYRAASHKVDRDEMLLVSHDAGEHFEVALSHPWKIPTCAMSSAALSEGPNSTLAAWETAGQIYFSILDPKGKPLSPPVAPVANAKQRHPSIAANAKGDILLSWTEGTAWEKGGAVAWQVFSANGKPTDIKGRADGVPVWSLVSAAARPDGSFVLFY